MADEYFTLFVPRITWQAIKDNVKTNKNNKRNISISRPMPNFVKVSHLNNKRSVCFQKPRFWRAWD